MEPQSPWNRRGRSYRRTGPSAPQATSARLGAPTGVSYHGLHSFEQAPAVSKRLRDKTLRNVFPDSLLGPRRRITVRAPASQTYREHIALSQSKNVLRTKLDGLVAALDPAESGCSRTAAEQTIRRPAKPVAVKRNLNAIFQDFVAAHKAQPAAHFAHAAAILTQRVFHHSEKSEVLIERLHRRVGTIRKRSIHAIAAILVRGRTPAAPANFQAHRPSSVLQLGEHQRRSGVEATRHHLVWNRLRQRLHGGIPGAIASFHASPDRRGSIRVQQRPLGRRNL